jgi:hypothetical protein
MSYVALWQRLDVTSIGDRAWWAYQCLPRDTYGAPPATTALEKKHGLHRGLIGKLHSGKQRTVEPEIGERLAKALGTTYDFLIRGIGPWPEYTHRGAMPPRPIKYSGKGPTKLDKVHFHWVKPDHQVAPAGATDPEELQGDLTGPGLELAAAQLKVRRPEWPMADINRAVHAIGGLRHQSAVDADSISKLAELVLSVTRGEISEKVISGLLGPTPSKPGSKSR